MFLTEIYLACFSPVSSTARVKRSRLAGTDGEEYRKSQYRILDGWDMDLSWLAGTGASAIVSAMATPAWEWTRSRLARLFSPHDLGREEAESSRLSAFASELATTSERDVQNRLRGFLEARLGDDPSLMNDFAVVVKEICVKLDLQPPTEWTSYVNAPGSVVVMAGQNADVRVGQGHPREVHITWAAMTTQEAARKLETLDRFNAAMELASMDPASAAR